MADGFNSAPRGVIATIGHVVLDGVAAVGRVGQFAAQGIRAAITPPWYPRQILAQFMAVGFLSLPVVGLTAWFTGAALALNIYSGGDRFNAETVLPQIVALGITRELGPVLAALMLAGRVASAMASEIGAMRATEQVDAMVTLSTDPRRYLIAPRLIAATLSLPLLTLLADVIGVAGGMQVSKLLIDLPPAIYVTNTVDFLTRWDIESGLIKSAVFGFIIGLMGCFHGNSASGGARGVGRATTSAMVSSAVLILAADYLLTSVFAKL
jgi:phospholipid/cholesterol/gamma-HCH transport system permease protein